MGMSVGSVSAYAYTPRTATMQSAARSEAAYPVETGNLGFGNSQQADIQAGFGENTLSPGAAALRTLDITLRSARSMVPTLEEALNEVQQHLAEENAAMDARQQSTSASATVPASTGTPSQTATSGAGSAAAMLPSKSAVPVEIAQTGNQAQGAALGFTPQRLLDILA